MAASGAGAPDDRPPGDDPLGGKTKEVRVLIPELSQEELMRHGVEPVVAPLLKRRCKKSGLRPFMEQDMCPEVRKRRVSRPAHGMAPPAEFSHGKSSVQESVPEVSVQPAQGASSKECSDSDSDSDSNSSLDSNASDVEHYLYEPVKDHHPIFSSPSDSDSDSETTGG
jgi:hypothetical protein